MRKGLLYLRTRRTRRAHHELHWNQGDPATPVWGLPVMLERNKAMNATELRDKTPDQLNEELTNLKKEAFNLRFQQATGQLENPARMRTVKRDVARIKTILNEKARAAAE